MAIKIFDTFILIQRIIMFTSNIYCIDLPKFGKNVKENFTLK